MRINKHRWWLVCLALCLSFTGHVFADSSASTNYRVDQTFFGSGGNLDASSANYRAKQTLGEVGAGNTSSPMYQAYAGFNTTDEPFLEFFVTTNTVNLGYLDTASASTTTGEFYVRAWQAEGYVVRTESDPPKNTQGAYNLAPMTAGGASSPGTEQFGINLVKNVDFICNTAPHDPACDLGEDPVQVPDNTFSFGEVATGYDTSNNFRYNKGDIVARSQRSTSKTIYKVSYLFNISPATPAGEYKFDHNLVATATY